MILAALILVAAGPCADRSYCPSRKEVERALQAQQDSLAFRLNEQANPPDSDRIVLMVIRRIVRVTGIHCDRPKGEPRGVTCRATVYRARSRPVTETIRLVFGPEGWKYADEDAG